MWTKGEEVSSVGCVCVNVRRWEGVGVDECACAREFVCDCGPVSGLFLHPVLRLCQSFHFLFYYIT